MGEETGGSINTGKSVMVNKGREGDARAGGRYE